MSFFQNILIISVFALFTMNCTPKVKNEQNIPNINLQKNDNHVILAELFTSQGCNSCPPAEDLLKAITQRDSSIILLSFHVDYWNYLGWKDPFSSSEYSNRQHNYNKTLNGDKDYTPQLIINGTDQMVGSNAKSINQSINDSQSLNTKSRISITKSHLRDHHAIIEYSIEQNFENCNINLALISFSEKTDVKAGENKGRLLESRNVVKYFKSQNAEKNGIISIHYQEEPFDQAVLFLQKKDQEITAVATRFITNLE
ncbi:MAG TPA: DUF1223 domain-containing protein [Saprospiraceae bacterium]|nr:DUF1223 domain-containing protein [Lewinellaceae bacterium]HPQ22176.1 DUF1223 domain-containing protein [Saprospiraceae bacterium]